MAAANTLSLLVAETEKRLAAFKQSYKGLSWREKVVMLTEVMGSLRKLGTNSDPRTAAISGRERIRLYLTEHVGVVIESRELEVVSGILDYPRRVRELRVQDGYKVLTGYSNDPDAGLDLSPSQYLLQDAEPDLTAARRWSIANRIRREHRGGSQGRILRFLQESVGQVVTSEELRYVAKASQFGRRTRELRTEEGYAIATKFTGRPDLAMGEYVLESAERIAQPHDRQIPLDVQKEVYERDDNTCRLCGWARDRWRKDDPRILELHHKTEHVEGGHNTAENLIALCSKCHDDVHAGRQELPTDS